MSAIDLRGLYSQPLPWRVYEFFAEGGGFTMPRPMGVKAIFFDEKDAVAYVMKNASNRVSYRIVNEKDLPK